MFIGTTAGKKLLLHLREQEENLCPTTGTREFV